MAYTLQISTDKDVPVTFLDQIKDRVVHILDQQDLAAREVTSLVQKTRAVQATEKAVLHKARIELRGIRLKESKPYCGNHPGPCLATTPKTRHRFLESQDWIDLNNAINDYLDELAPYLLTNVYTQIPGNGTLWIRKNGKRRVRWDYKETGGGVDPPRREWVRGSGEGPEQVFQFKGPRSDTDYCLVYQDPVGAKEPIYNWPPGYEDWKEAYEKLKKDTVGSRLTKTQSDLLLRMASSEQKVRPDSKTTSPLKALERKGLVSLEILAPKTYMLTNAGKKQVDLLLAEILQTQSLWVARFHKLFSYLRHKQVPGSTNSTWESCP